MSNHQQPKTQRRSTQPEDIPFNGLSPSEDERLSLLAEECAEVIQAICKIQRHGYESRHPDGAITNRQHLEKECGDVHHAITRLIISGSIDPGAIALHSQQKAKSVGKYLHHAG